MNTCNGEKNGLYPQRREIGKIQPGGFTVKEADPNRSRFAITISGW
jgi:hypothetical protein